MLTALEAFLVSLYGFRPADDPPAQQPLSSETSSAPSEALQPDKDNSRASTDLLEDVTAVRTDPSLHSQTSNGSSSSSLADDWIVNSVPAGFESVDDQSCRLSAKTNSVNELPERLEDNVPSTDKSREQVSAEDWSRGTAFSDPVSGMPLQPVSIHQPLKVSRSSPDQTPSPSNKKIPNAITEKRAALTAYDLISSRAMRAPLSPAALFEKEARADVLREKPAASLQDISAAVHERWKNLREEDRKK